MVLFVGEAVTIRAEALDPLRKTVITDAVAKVEFYVPGKDPKNIPADRVADGPAVAMTYDAPLKLYLGFVSTAGWAPGKWSFKVTLAGTYNSWEYGTFQLKA